MMTYIVLYNDGTMLFFNKPQEAEDFTGGTRFFKTPDKTNVISVCEWIGQNYFHPAVEEIF